jgi:hypothetical protein
MYRQSAAVERIASIQRGMTARLFWASRIYRIREIISKTTVHMDWLGDAEPWV